STLGLTKPGRRRNSGSATTRGSSSNGPFSATGHGEPSRVRQRPGGPCGRVCDGPAKPDALRRSARHVQSWALAVPTRRADADIPHKLCGNEMAQAGEESALAVVFSCLTKKTDAPSRAERRGRLAHRRQHEIRRQKLLHVPKVRGDSQPCGQRQLAAAKVP